MQPSRSRSPLRRPQTPIARWFLNTVIVATITTVVVLAVDALAAYAYARLEFPGRKFLFGMLLATLFLPGVMFLVPNFVTVDFFERGSATAVVRGINGG